MCPIINLGRVQHLGAARHEHAPDCPLHRPAALRRRVRFFAQVWMMWPFRHSVPFSAERSVPADEKSGLHVCFVAPSAEAVDAFHAAALRAGGQDNGAPGPRPIHGPDYYAAFIIDPDGYRIEAYYGPPET